MVSNLASNDFDYRQFYSLVDPLATMPYRMNSRRTENWPNLEQQYALVEGKYKPTGPLIFDAGRGGKAMDVLWSTSGLCFFFSDRLVTLLYENNVSGWNTYEVELYDKRGNRLEGYHGIAITGPECRRDRSRSEIVYRPSPAGLEKTYPYYRGLYFLETDWDGSDMFWVSEGGGKIITDKVSRILRQHRIRNLHLIPLIDVEIAVRNDRFVKPPASNG